MRENYSGSVIVQRALHDFARIFQRRSVLPGEFNFGIYLTCTLRCNIAKILLANYFHIT